MSTKTKKLPILKAPPFYGITRLDQPEKKNHGFYVRIAGEPAKFFADGKWGRRKTALEAAQNHRDGIWRQMPVKRQESILRRQPRKLK